MPEDLPEDQPDRPDTPIDRAQDAIDEAHEAAQRAVPPDPLEGTEPQDPRPDDQPPVEEPGQPSR